MSFAALLEGDELLMPELFSRAWQLWGRSMHSFSADPVASAAELQSAATIFGFLVSAGAAELSEKQRRQVQTVLQMIGSLTVLTQPEPEKPKAPEPPPKRKCMPVSPALPRRLTRCQRPLCCLEASSWEGGPAAAAPPPVAPMPAPVAPVAPVVAAPAVAPPVPPAADPPPAAAPKKEKREKKDKKDKEKPAPKEEKPMRVLQKGDKPAASAAAAPAAAAAAVDVSMRSPWMPPPPRRPTMPLLAAAPEANHKQMLGEWLFPQLAALPNVSDPAKITGMLLELDNATLVGLASDKAALITNVDKAVNALEQFLKGGAKPAAEGGEGSAGADGAKAAKEPPKPKEPRVPHPNAKTRLCTMWVQRGYCKYGSKCDFAHGTYDMTDAVKNRTQAKVNPVSRGLLPLQALRLAPAKKAASPPTAAAAPAVAAP